MTSFSADGPNVQHMLARLEKSKTAYQRSDQFAYSRGYLEGMAHVELIVREELARKNATPATPIYAGDVVPCDNCGEDTPADTEQILFCSGEGASLIEGPVCVGCLERADVDTCLKCNGVWWTRVSPPYNDVNCPGSVCQACFAEAVAND